MGGGVIGLSCAYYLRKSGAEVVVIDKNKPQEGCSFGNAGYISPSHFIPLATPGIVWKGLKWMLDSSSPFYIKPRLDKRLIKWGIEFIRSANDKTVKENAPHLFHILNLSRTLTIELNQALEQGPELKLDGCYMLYHEPSTAQHELELAREARQHFGIDVEILTATELAKEEPLISPHILGGAYYPIDGHVHPVKLMQRLYSSLSEMGVKIVHGEEIIDAEVKNSVISRVITAQNSYTADEYIMAAGSWSGLLAEKLNLYLPMQAGKGYSYTFPDIQQNLKKPAILVDHRVAMTPLGNSLRVGGTMELSGINHTINMNRIHPIINAANEYFPALNLYIPNKQDVWSGLRPLSPDGLPYIGRTDKMNNFLIATGHAMIGISLCAATGWLISQIIEGKSLPLDMKPFHPDRFE